MTAPIPRGADRVVLVGFMGAGKSTVGRELARRLKWTFIDTDEVIERAAGMSIADIFAREGELGFRDREARAVEAAMSEPSAVVAVGGGAVVREEVRSRIWSRALVVYLEADADSLASRIDRDETDRPLAQGSFPHDLLNERRTLYEVAHHTEATGDRSASDVADSITRWMRST